MEAISTALEVLGFLELPEDQVPPEEYWHSQEHIRDWFEAVKRRLSDEHRGIKSIEPGEDLDDPDPYVDPEVSALRG